MAQNERISIEIASDEKNKIYFIKEINLGKKTFLRRINTVFRKNEWWKSEKSFGFWWKSYRGVGIKGKKDKEFKYFMIGLNLYNTKFWIDMAYIGKRIKSQTIELKD